MVLLKQGSVSDSIIVTLYEKKKLDTPYFIFVFIHITTKDKVELIKYFEEDESVYPERFSEFTIDTSVIFQDMPTGQWHYEVYENTTSSIAEDLNLLENGKMLLQDEQAIVITGQATQTKYKGYGGN